MAAQRSSRIGWLVALVLVSAAGLVGLGVHGMSRALRNAELTARDEARSATFDTARAVRGVLARPELLELFDASARFELGADGPVLPAALATVLPAEAVLSVEARSVLERAERSEFAAGDAQRAGDELDTALASAWPPADRAALQLARAWNADRRGDAETRDSLVAKVTGTGSVDLRASLLLLLAKASLPLPGSAALTLATMPADEARALLARMQEIAPARDFGREQRAIEHAAAQRTVIERVRRQGGRLLDAKAVVAAASRDGVLLYQPASRRGVVTGSRRFFETLRDATDGSGELPLVPWSGRLVFGETTNAEAVVLFEGVALEPAARTPADIASSPLYAGALLAVLGTALVLGMWLILRGLARERAAVTARSDFLNSVTHELKTPLSSIRMFAELLDEDRVPESGRRHDYYRMLATEAGRLSALVENVLDLGRTERGERSYDIKRIAFDEVVRECLALFDPVATRAGLSVEAAVEAADVEADRGSLVQAVLNLLDNAAKYAGSGTNLRIALVHEAGRAALSIEDDGPGIPASERELVFERFERGRAQSDGAIPGVGLGLYLARTIVRTQGGDLRCVAPTMATGARFVLTLPTVDGEEH